jgi:hypothetical protein
MVLNQWKSSFSDTWKAHKIEKKNKKPTKLKNLEKYVKTWRRKKNITLGNVIWDQYIY